MEDLTSSSPLSKYVRVDTSPLRLARLWSRVSDGLASSPGHRIAWWKPSLVGLLAVAMTLGVWLLIDGKAAKSTWHAAALETSTDGLRVELDDGARLELAAKTRLFMLNDQPQHAAVRIERGRVVCDLAKRFERRFSVFAGGIEVRVTGTRFSVELEPTTGRLEVAVERGSVLVLDAQGSEPSRTLRAGERWSTTRQPRQLAQAVAQQEPQRADATVVPTQQTGSVPAASASALASSEPLDSAPSSGASESAPRNSVSAAATTEPWTARMLFDQGNVARRAGDPSGAAKAYQALLTKFPTDSRAGLAAFELGRLRMGPLGDLPGAVAALKTAIGLLSGSAFREDAMARLVEAYAASGQFAPCRSARDAYLREYPNGVHAALIGRQCGKY